MTYNIRNAVAGDGDNRWESRRDQLFGQIALVGPDILGLQEVLPGQRTDLGTSFPSYEFLGVTRSDENGEGESANLAVRRDQFEIRSSGTYWLSDTPDKPSRGWDSAFPRIATWAKLKRRSDGLRIFALNTHLDHRGALARLQGARQIAAFVTAHRRPREAVVVLGDLNAIPGSPALAALLEGEAGLRDSRADSLAPPIGPEGTYNGFQPLPEQAKRIDYVLHGAGLRTIRHATLAWHHDHQRVASDHFPVVADLVSAECRP